MNDNPQSISEVVELAAQRHDASCRQLAQIAQSHGFQITAATVDKLRARTNKSSPTPDTVRVIAWLAGVSEEVAFTAAGQTVPGPPLGEELPPGADNLPPKARKAVIEYTRVLIDQQEQIRELTQQLEAAGQALDRVGGEAPARADLVINQKTAAGDQFSATIGVKTGASERGEEEAPAGGRASAHQRAVEAIRGAFDLAAHSDVPLARDRFEAEHGVVPAMVRS